MKNRTWNERHHHRNRLIARRLAIVRNAWHESARKTDTGTMIVGRHYGALSKFNLVCSCLMCRGDRYNRRKDRWTHPDAEDA